MGADNDNHTTTADIEPRFSDLLEQIRNRNDVSWVCRNFRPRLAYAPRLRPTGSCINPNPLVFRYKVLTDPRIYSIIRQTYPNESAAHSFQRIHNILAEIGHLKSLTVVRCIGFVLIKILKKVTHSIFVNETKLFQIRSKMGNNPVVFVPNHRSYADFILMAFICFCYDIDIPVVVAAMDFHAMFGVASLLRQCGAMYMRRSFKHDRVYRAVFEKYVQTVISEGQTPFEFFIEGGRSRCGKSLMPKLGVLKMIVQLYLERTVEDITFVPVSFNFDRLMEDSLFVREVMGIPKPKESMSGLLRGISLLEKQYGDIYINIGDEISLKELDASGRESNLLATLAHTIVNKQQCNTVLTYFNILSTVIIHYLMRENSDCFLITMLVREVTNLKDILVAFGARIYWPNTENEMKRTLGMHTFLVLDQSEEFIRLPFVSNSGHLRKNPLDTANHLILLQHYSNPCYCFLVNAASLVLILITSSPLDKDQLFLKYSLFRLLFKHEFLFYEAFAIQDFNNACNILQFLNILETTKQNDGFKLVSLASARREDSVWFNLMLPYLRGYSFVYQSLAHQLSQKKLNRTKLTERIRKQVELEYRLSNDTSLCYAFSSHLISCAHSSLLDAGVLSLERSTDNLVVLNSDRLKAAESFLNSLLGRTDSSIPLSIISCVNKL